MNQMHVKYLLAGGGVSSAAAEAIRLHDAEGSVLLVGQEVNRPYHRPPLSGNYLLGRRFRTELFTLPDSWFVENRVELRNGRRVTRLDASTHTVALDSGQEISFHRLLIATGASPRRT